MLAQLRIAALAILIAAPFEAAAQTKLVPKDDSFKGAGEEDVQGWNPSLAGTATINLVSNTNVVGQVDGFSTLVGLGLVAGMDYVDGRHVLRNTLTLAESFARTPVVDELVKTNDAVQLEGLYNYYLAKSFGLYGRLALQTSVFAATDIRGVATTWVEKTDPPTPLTTDAFRQRLAGPFRPFTINESAGVFADPYKTERLALSVRAGIGGRHTFADSVLLIDDDKATEVVELVRLADVHQLGLELFGGASGKIRDGKLAYRAGLAVLFPAVNNDKFDRGVGTLTRIAFEGSATFTVFDWMSVVYTVAITRDAQLFPEGNELTQLQNSLLLTLTYTFVEKSKKPKEPSALELELIAAKQRADTAEALALELQKQLEACTTRCPAPAAPAAPAAPPAP